MYYIMNCWTPKFSFIRLHEIYTISTNKILSRNYGIEKKITKHILPCLVVVTLTSSLITTNPLNINQLTYFGTYFLILKIRCLNGKRGYIYVNVRFIKIHETAHKFSLRRNVVMIVTLC